MKSDLKGCKAGFSKRMLMGLSAVMIGVLLPVLSVVTIAEETTTSKLETLKKKALKLNRELFILEEDLLFPANTQVSVFLSMDVGEFFQLDSVELKLNDKLVASHLYTERQVNALHRGGIQRLFVGNLKSGEHEITAVFTGFGPEKRPYKRATTYRFDKTSETRYLELVIQDSTRKYQPTFSVKEWE